MEKRCAGRYLYAVEEVGEFFGAAPDADDCSTMEMGMEGCTSQDEMQGRNEKRKKRTKDAIGEGIEGASLA